MNKFTVNNKTYNAKEFDFDLVCDLEEMDIQISTIKNKPMALARAYFALCVGGDKHYAGQEMQKHILNGGNFDELMDVMNDEMEKSDFFQALSKTEDAEVAASQTAEKEEK